MQFQTCSGVVISVYTFNIQNVLPQRILDIIRYMIENHGHFTLCLAFL